MKSILISFTSLLFVLTISVTSAFAQNGCSKFYPFNEGSKFQVTTYDKRDKQMTVADYKVMDVTGSGNEKVGTINSVIKDKKNKEIANTSFKVTCNGSVVSIDIESMMNPQMLEQFENMEYEITGTNIDWPNNLSVGQQLPDAVMDMQISMSGINMNMKVTITDRKVIGQETISSPAGSFNCYVVTSTTETKMGMSQETTTKQWITEKAGMVKSENYDRRGNINSYSLLTQYTE